MNKALGINLLEWQKDVIRDWLAIDERGQFIHRRNGLSVPRQSGKSFLTIAVCNYLMLVMNMRIAFTAHNYSTVGDIFDRFKRLYGYRANDKNAPNKELNSIVKNVRGATSRECIELNHVKNEDGEFDPCCSFSTRTDSSLRGQSFDVLISDESQELQNAQLSSILPVTNAGPRGNHLTIFLGTPETPASRGRVFGKIRDDAMSGESDDISWNEWGVTEVGDVRDKSRWYETNPSLGILSDESSLQAASGSMEPFDFAQEYLGYWYKRDSQEQGFFDEAAWDSLAISAASTPKEGTPSFAIKFAPDGMSGCVAACRKHDDGRYHVEVVTVRSLADGLSFFIDFAIRREGSAGGFAIDGGGPANIVYEQLLKHDVPKAMLRKVNAYEFAAACSMLADCVLMKSMTHIAQPGLDDSVKFVRKRQVGKSGFGFEGIGEHSELPTETIALAMWAAEYIDWEPDDDLQIG